MAHPTLSMFRKLQGKPLGTWLFSRLVCFKAPYFASIAPRISSGPCGLSWLTSIVRI